MNNTLTIIGQGYVGLPLAQAATEVGWKVFGFDVSSRTVDGLNAGRSHIDDIDDAEVERMLDLGYEATSDEACISKSDVVVVCVPTPLADAGAPDLTAVESAARAIGRSIRSGSLVILESTTYPGTTEDVFGPIIEDISGLERGVGFELAFSPERVDPGNPKFGIKNTPKLVGGASEVATQLAVDFYGGFIDTVVPLSGAKEAETAKLLENTFRHVNIALVNEMAKFCYELGIDIWEAIRGAATKPFGFMKFTPGPGVGGHCIPIDPNYLSYEVRKELGYPFRFVELAQEINHSMPRYVVSRATDKLNDASLPLRGSNVLLLGVTYKPDIADQRESPAKEIGELFRSKGADLKYHDPFVPEWFLDGVAIKSEPDPYVAAENADIVIVLQNHSFYDLDKLAVNGSKLLDTKGVVPSVEWL